MATLRLAILFIALASSIVSAEQLKFPGYKVFRIIPKNEAEVQLVQQLETMGVSFWSGPNPPDRSSDVMVPPHMFDLIHSVRSAGINVTEYISDVQKLIDETSGKALRRRKEDPFPFHEYHRFDEIVDWLRVQESLHSSFVSTFSIGKSTEGRDLVIMKIAKPSENPKKAIWLDANIHAREWITSAVTLYIVNEMLNGNNPIYEQWIEDYDWYILPVHNPDGFEFSHTNNRMWRKTRSGSGFCKGVDPNRNWDFQWMTGGSSSNPCSDTYAGSSAFSEPETKLTSDFINTIASELDAFISLHSYSQLILIPYGVRIEFPPHEVHMAIGRRVASAIARTEQKVFTPGNIVDLLYVASGGSMDWAKGIHDIPLTFTFELRDTGNYGFILPPDQIIPSGIELLDGLEVIVDALREGIPPSK